MKKKTNDNLNNVSLPYSGGRKCKKVSLRDSKCN